MGLSKAVEKNLVTVLKEDGLITSDQLEHVLSVHEESKKDISQILVEEELLTDQELAIIAGLQHTVPVIDLKQRKIDPQALRMIPEAMARRYNVIPIEVIGDVLMVAMEDPWNIRAIEDMTAQARMSIYEVEAVPADIRKFIDASYKVSSEVEKEISHIPEAQHKDASSKQKAKEERISAEVIAQTPIVRAVDLIMEQAVKDRASDVHIAPEENRVRIRYRIDGILHEAMSLPLSVHLPLVSRLKILAGMNIADRRRPQDGQFSIKTGGRAIDVRVATSDTVNGEMVVMRILDKSFALLGLTELGFLPDALARYQHMLNSPFGIILLSGPTGSGKTTSLYASVNQLNDGERNIMTIEDPVEYRFAGINQVQVNASAGMSFSDGLRALMRLDPDIILVGEIRDRETAQIAVQASLTGHLVLSSIHANDTVGSIFRLLDLGIEPFLISSSLVGVVAQRMIRRVCSHCRKPTKAPAEERLIYERELEEKRSEFYYGKGCNSCANTGYRGRCGVYEILEMTEESRRLVLSNGSASDIRKQAIKDGMVPMWRDGMLKVKQGITTPYELLRNVYSIAQ
ncbi:MAG: ATPase, T2SS/T4P/T4SS family [Dehalococcoidia bacterium]|nr:ATPase, T2SS/T4P/T4SS family [Dehalococcoidia bacterium]